MNQSTVIDYSQSAQTVASHAWTKCVNAPPTLICIVLFFPAEKRPLQWQPISQVRERDVAVITSSSWLVIRFACSLSSFWLVSSTAAPRCRSTGYPRIILRIVTSKNMGWFVLLFLLTQSKYFEFGNALVTQGIHQRGWLGKDASSVIGASVDFTSDSSTLRNCVMFTLRTYCL